MTFEAVPQGMASSILDMARDVRAFQVARSSLELLNLFVFTQFRTQNRCPLLRNML